MGSQSYVSMFVGTTIHMMLVFGGLGLINSED